MLVATKYGAPCELNGHTRDFSAEACVAAMNRSMENLRQQPIACLQLHSPPELPSPLHNSRLVNVLANAKAQGAISGWGASVHSMRGGHTALAAGADMLQLGFSVLSQELAPLLAQCAVARRGTLIQNVLCQGWLTETGVAAARLLLAAPRSTPRTAPTSYPMINFHGLLHAVLRLHTLAERCGSSVSELAIRFVLQTPGVSSALVQVRTASQLRGLLTPDVASTDGGAFSMLTVAELGAPHVCPSLASTSTLHASPRWVNEDGNGFNPSAAGTCSPSSHQVRLVSAMSSPSGSVTVHDAVRASSVVGVEGAMTRSLTTGP